MNRFNYSPIAKPHFPRITVGQKWIRKYAPSEEYDTYPSFMIIERHDGGWWCRTPTGSLIQWAERAIWNCYYIQQ
jgi:hypothetical protein